MRFLTCLGLFTQCLIASLSNDNHELHIRDPFFGALASFLGAQRANLQGLPLGVDKKPVILKKPTTSSSDHVSAHIFKSMMPVEMPNFRFWSTSKKDILERSDNYLQDNSLKEQAPNEKSIYQDQTGDNNHSHENHEKMQHDIQYVFDTKPNRAGYVHIEDHKIYYEVHQTGTAPIYRLALIIGFQSDILGWSDILNYFTNDPRYSVLVVDNRGSGKSTSGKLENYSTDNLAMDYMLVLRHIGWSEDVHVVSFSLGGMIAQKMIVTESKERELEFKLLKSPTRTRNEAKTFKPRLFKSLIQIATCSQLKFAADTPSVFQIAKVPLSSAEEKVEFFLKGLYSNVHWLQSYDSRFPHFANNRERMKAILTDAPEPSMACFLGQGSAILSHYVSVEELNIIGETCKVGIIAGMEDMVISHDCSDHLHKHMGGTYQKLEGYGHGLIFEAHHHVLQLILSITQDPPNKLDHN